MKDNESKLSCKQGFTLIELLVVVLIIGILAAVAVPQYKVAVAKARAIEARANLNAIAQAQRVYYLAHGEFTDNLNELDVKIKPKYFCNLIQDGKKADCWSPQTSDGYKLNKSVSQKGVSFYCVAYKESVMGNKICKAMGTFAASESAGSSTYDYYYII